MSNYVVIVSYGKGVVAQWYEPQLQKKKKVKLFDSFDEAKGFMRRAIKSLVTRSPGFGLEKGKSFAALKFWLEEHEYSEYDREDKQAYEAADKLIHNLVFDENYLPADRDILEFDFDDAGDWYFNYLIERDRVIINHYGLHISFNIHSPNNPQNQYFCLRKETDDEPLAELAVELLKIDK